MNPLVYVAGPYSAKTREEVKDNVRRAELEGMFLLQNGMIPIIPHKITSDWDVWGPLADWEHHNWLYNFCLPLLLRCDALYTVEGWKESKGANIEHRWAISKNIPVLYTIAEARQYMDTYLKRREEIWIP